MLKLKKNNKKYIGWMVTIGLFGIVGLLLVPVVNYTIKLVNRYPKLFKWFFIIVCICGVLFIENWNTRLIIICIGVALTRNKLATNSR
ncbi:MAG: hypothetical protein UE295_09270 [Acutalibacteraceae bacterium]|nr:hypothetical protein [Acutalibacteraceae bacterium]